MTIATDDNTFHRFHCAKCDSTHYEHERTKHSFARFVAKHVSRCGKGHNRGFVSIEDVLPMIQTREAGVLHVPEAWSETEQQRLGLSRSLAKKFGLNPTAR